MSLTIVSWVREYTTLRYLPNWTCSADGPTCPELVELVYNPRKICRNRIPYDYRTVLAEPARILFFLDLFSLFEMEWHLSYHEVLHELYKFLSERWSRRVCSTAAASSAL